MGVFVTLLQERNPSLLRYRVLWRTLLLSTFVATLVGVPAMAFAANEVSVGERIARGKAAMDALEYETAAEELTIAAIDENANEEERIEANLYAGMAHRILNRDVDAKLNFVYVLKHRPQTRLPAGTSPKIRNFFELIRQEVELTRPRPDDRPAKATTVAPTSTDKTKGGSPTAKPSATATEPMEGGSTLPLFGGVVAAAGAGLLLIGAAGAAGAEFSLGLTEVSSTNKELAYVGFYGALATAAVGAVAIGVGGALFLVTPE